MHLVEAIVEGYGKEGCKACLTVRLLGFKKVDAILENVGVLTSFANQKSGMVCFPEIGDRVVISFLDEHFTQAICLGSSIPKDCELLEECTQDHSIKQAKTSSGFQMIVEEREENASLSLKSKSGLMIQMDEEQQIVKISQQDQKQCIAINMLEKSVNIEGEDCVSLRCGDAKIEMKQGNLSFYGKEINIEGSTLLVNTAKETTLKSVNSTISSSNQSVVHGATCEVSADVKQVIKGALIQIG